MKHHLIYALISCFMLHLQLATITLKTQRANMYTEKMKVRT